MSNTDPFAALPSIDPWMCQHLHCLPSTHGHLIILELVFMFGFGFAALAIAIGYKFFSGTFALLYVCRSGIGNGAIFPVTVLFIFYPVSENIRGLLSLEQALIALMGGSFVVAVTQVVALLKGP